jgi:hypothetical protein
MPGRRSSSSLDALLRLTTPGVATLVGFAACASARTGLACTSQVAQQSAIGVDRDNARMVRLLEVMNFLLAVVVAHCRAHAAIDAQ